LAERINDGGDRGEVREHGSKASGGRGPLGLVIGVRHEPVLGILAIPRTLGLLSWWTTWGLSDGVLDAGQGVGGGGASG